LTGPDQDESGCDIVKEGLRVGLGFDFRVWEWHNGEEQTVLAAIGGYGSLWDYSA